MLTIHKGLVHHDKLESCSSYVFFFNQSLCLRYTGNSDRHALGRICNFRISVGSRNTVNRVVPRQWHGHDCRIQASKGFHVLRICGVVFLIICRRIGHQCPAQGIRGIRDHRIHYINIVPDSRIIDSLLNMGQSRYKCNHKSHDTQGVLFNGLRHCFP